MNDTTARPDRPVREAPAARVPADTGGAERPSGDRLNPAQRRTLDELLCPTRPRPAVEAGLAARLRSRVEAGTRAAARHIPPGGRLVVTKSSLNALDCDGRFLDRLDTTFTWELPMVRGKLAHRAVEHDWRTGRTEPAEGLVERAWRDLRDEQEELRGLLDGLDVLTAADLRGEACRLVLELRDTWPAVPLSWSPRLETPVSVTFADGAVQARGRPDLLIGRAHPARRQMIVVDLKTGWRQPLRDRRDLRFYALLITMKYGVEPFRLVTYYVSEGAWDAEDVTPRILEDAADVLSDACVRAARLTYERPVEQALRLVADRHCRWCSRAPGCRALDAEGIPSELAPHP